MKYAHYNENTLELLGWYSKDIHGTEIPEPYFEITDEYWSECLISRFNKVDLETETLFYEETFESYKDRREGEERLAHNRVLSSDIVLGVLGVDYIYPNEYYTDLTLYQSISIGGSHKVKCRAIDSEDWGFVAHDSDQIKTVASTFLNNKQDALEAIEKIKNAAANCTTKEELETALSRL